MEWMNSGWCEVNNEEVNWLCKAVYCPMRSALGPQLADEVERLHLEESVVYILVYLSTSEVAFSAFGCQHGIAWFGVALGCDHFLR
jgi:hypothetical protein